MLTNEQIKILENSQERGWVLEPDAKSFLRLAGLPVPHYGMATTFAEAIDLAQKIGWPVVAKVVSPAVIHKSDVGGVAVNISDADTLRAVWDRFAVMDAFVGMLVEEMLPPGLECIVGARNDFQFGPVVLFGMGGVGVEIYQDTALRMAPLLEKGAASMVESLKASRLFDGYRGSTPVDKKALAHLLVTFSNLIMELGDRFESIDVNPVRCFASGCVVADARIMLPRDGSTKHQG